MNTDHYIGILAVKDSLIEKLHGTIGTLEKNLKMRIEYEKELSAKLMDALDELKVYYEKDARLLYQNLEE